MRRRLTIVNPSEEPRGGLVISPWRAGDAPPSSAAQIDLIDPEEPERAELALQLDQTIPPGEQTIELPDAESAPGASVAVFPSGVLLESDAIRLWFTLGPQYEHAHWFGGAITSVQVDSFEMLDPIASEWGFPFPSEKRLQVDRVRIPDQPRHAEPEHEQQLFSRPWRCVAHGSGPVRAWATVASPSFEYITAMRGEAERFACTLYRTLSVFPRRAMLLDVMWLHARVEAGGTVPFWFAPHIFMYANLGLSARISSFPGWFTIGLGHVSRSAYGFAADTSVTRVDNPPAGYPKPEEEHKAFGWELGFGRTIRTLHLFQRTGEMSEFTDRTGRTWFELLHKPLQAKSER